jgi:hypothetical protein
MPRAISPSASDGTLPCSAVRCAASSWRWASTRFRIRNMISVRFEMEVARQPGNAARAAATAASTSSTDARSTSRATTPRAGSKTGPRRPEVPATRRPPIQCGTASDAEMEAAIPGSATWVMRGVPRFEGVCSRPRYRAGN